MNKKASAMKSMWLMTLVTGIALVIASLWEKIPSIKENVHKIFDPSLGVLLNWDLTYGMLIIIFVLSSITLLVQKFTTDQNAIRELKKEQKQVQEEMKKYRDNPEKMMELNKSMMPTTWKIMEITMKSSFYTIIPLILLFRWFMDYFAAIPEFRFFHFFTWFWFYLLGIIIFSSIMRKWFNVA